MAQQIADCRLVPIDAGHLVHTARPAEFLAALRSFGMDRDIDEPLAGGVSPG
jgi:pimeloyl-ACP methyl ester carboxylesterase